MKAILSVITRYILKCALKEDFYITCNKIKVSEKDNSRHMIYRFNTSKYFSCLADYDLNIEIDETHVKYCHSLIEIHQCPEDIKCEIFKLAKDSGISVRYKL